MASTRALRVETPEQSRAILQGVLAGNPGPAREIVLLNAAAALYAANVSSSIAQGLEAARQALDSGAAQAKLAQFIAATQAA